MNRRKIILITMTILVVMFLTGCATEEERASRLFVKAHNYTQKREHEKAYKMYKKIVIKFPETSVAKEVNKLLGKEKIVIDSFKRNLLNDKIELLKTALHLYELDTGNYPTTQEGLSALAVKPKGKGNWKGPYLSDENFLLGPWKHKLIYQVIDKDKYQITSYGPDGIKSEDDIGIIVEYD